MFVFRTSWFQNTLSTLLLLYIHHAYTSQHITLSPEQAQAIGLKIWENECRGSIEGLTSWNQGENFASLGIGHFIWYPAGERGRFVETFPELLDFLAKKKAKLPHWLKAKEHPVCPWHTREEFIKDCNREKLTSLRQLLSETVALQIEFIILRLENALPHMLQQLPQEHRERIVRQFYRTTDAPQGIYALVDYLNFKGEGTSPSERYNDQGWGLLQVLQGMQGTEPGRAALEEFSASAKAVLMRRVENSPTERNEKRWLQGWINRVEKYKL
jgi:hypothetical protein